MAEHPITSPAELVEQWRTAQEWQTPDRFTAMLGMTETKLQAIAAELEGL